MYWLVPTFPMGVLHGNRDRVEPPGPNLVKSRDPLADPIDEFKAGLNNPKSGNRMFLLCKSWCPFHITVFWKNKEKRSTFSRPDKCINSSPPSATYMRQWSGPASVQIMTCRLFGAKPLPEPMLTYCQVDSWEQISAFKTLLFSFKKM